MPEPWVSSNGLDWELVNGLIHIKGIHLSMGDALEQAILGGVGIMSFLVVSALLVYFVALAAHPGREFDRRERARSLRRFLLSDMGVYFISLLLCDLGPAISAIGNVYWSTQYMIDHSTLCDFQGASNQFGVSGTVFWNLALAVQTFLLLVVRYQPPRWVKWVVLATGWLFGVAMTIVGPIMNKSPFSFFGPNSAGCWLTFGSSHFVAWFWTMAYLCLIVGLIMTVIYILVFLSLTGALAKVTGRTPSQTSSRNGATGAAERGHEVRKVARKMLWFPLSFGLLSIPLAVSVVLAARGKTLQHSYYIVANVLWVSNGVADVIIFVLTRQHLLRSPPSSPSPTSSSTTSDPSPGGSDIEFTSASAVSLTLKPFPPTAATVYPAIPETRPVFNYLAPLKDGEEKEKGDGNGMSGRAPGTPTAFQNFQPPPGVGDGRRGSRGSRVERKARKEGSEDSIGLVTVQKAVRF